MATRKLEVVIAGDSRSLERSFASASRSAKGFSVGLGTLAKSAAVIGGLTAAAAGMSAALRSGFSEFSDASKAAAATAAALKSTGGVANVTAKQVDALATAVMNYSGIDDEAVKAGENLLLTFKQVRNEAGKGNAVFDRATRAAVDLSVRGFGSIETTAKQLGKALNDPVRGMTALGRAGVTFTEGQRKQIKALVETGKTLEAQKLILREVESQVGGSARALGQTLPGQLSRLRESLKNTLGDLAGSVAPALTGALGAFNDFLGDLGKARTVSAKLDVVWSGAKDAAKKATSVLGAAVAGIDWDEVWARARGVADGLQRQLEQVDFSAVGKRIGDAFSDAARVALPAAKDMADRISRAVDQIDWEKMGRAMGPGLAQALATAVKTLLDPGFWARNWDLVFAIALTMAGGALGKFAAKLGALTVRAVAVISPRLASAMAGVAIEAIQAFGVAMARIGPALAKALAPLGRIVGRVFGRLGRLAVFTVKVLGIQAALNAIAGFVRSVGRAFAGIGRAIGDAFTSALDFVVEKAVRAALAIVEPFSHLPRKLGGGPFQALKGSLKAQLDGMASDAKDTAQKVNTAMGLVKSRTVTLGVNVEVNGKPAAQAGGGAGLAKAITGPVEAFNAVFSAALARANEIVKAATSKAADGAKQRKAAAAKAAAAAKSAAEAQRKQFDALIGSLGLQVDQAAATKGFADDLAANARLQAAIRAQIKVEGNTTDLARQLFEAQQARAQILAQQAQAVAEARQKAAARIQAAQFRALGLTGTGDQRTPGVPNLKKQLEQLTARLGPDVAPKIAAQLAGIRKVLTDPIHKATLETRKAIVQMFETIRGTFDQQASKAVAPRSVQISDKILAALGFGKDPDVARLLKTRPGTLAALSPRLPAVSTAGVQAAGGGVTISGPITVVADNPDAFLRELQKHAGRTTATARGRFPGRSLGLA